jgi:hypothetical protein
MATNKVTLYGAFVNHAALNSAKAVYKKISLSVDANYTAYIYVDGVEVMRTDAIKDWRATSNGGVSSKDAIYINSWRFNYVSNTGSNTALLYFDEALAYHDGTILK